MMVCIAGCLRSNDSGEVTPLGHALQTHHRAGDLGFEYERALYCKKGMIDLMSWTVVFVNNEVKAVLDALPLDMRASFERIVSLMKSNGLEKMREPYVKHLEGPLWEMRMKGRDGIARAVYVTAVGKRVVVVHVFQKKTQKTPRHEIVIALKRAKELQ
jgi:phage-related protein